MNRRTEYTKNVIKMAFLESMKQKKFVDISVAEVCRMAEINRSTFYLHYHRIDDVLNEIIDEIIQNIDDVFSQFNPDKRVCNRALCQFIRNNEKYQPVLLDESLGEYIIGKLGQHFMADYIEYICNRTDLCPDEVKQIFWFQLHGCFSVAKHNLLCGEEKWLKIKCTLDTFIRRGLFGSL